jgi:NAD(P)-dependent dehydrogenase (short-subunit alcohol dehydrogenase family)
LSGSFSFDLKERTVLVTGASSGIGRHFALRLAASGAKVVLCARRIGMLKDLKETIEGSNGRACAVAMDTSDEKSVISAYDIAQAEFGSIDSVIANAGMNIGGSALGIAAADIDKIASVNMSGVFLTAREGARRMVAAGSADRRHGRIVIISSITANHVFPGVAAYSATKAAICQLGRVFAREWANKGINVNTICPGYMKTELNSEYWGSQSGRDLLRSFPRKRLMEVEALDSLVLYLCSDVSAQVTGSEFKVDDGQSLT